MLGKFPKSNLEALEVRFRTSLKWGFTNIELRPNLRFQGFMTIFFAVTASLFGPTKATLRGIGSKAKGTGLPSSEQPREKITQASGCLTPPRKWVFSGAFKLLLPKDNNPILPTLSSPNRCILALKSGQRAVIIRATLKTMLSRDTGSTGGRTVQVLKATGSMTRWAASASLNGTTAGHIAVNSKTAFLAVLGFISGLTGVVTRAIIGTMSRKASVFTRILTARGMKESGATGFSTVKEKL